MKKTASLLKVAVILCLFYGTFSLAQVPDTIWTKTYGGTDTDRAWSVRQTADNGYIIAGCTGSFGAGGDDVWLLKTDANGDTLWTKTYGGADSDCGYAVQQTADNGYIIVGQTNSFGAGLNDIWLLRVDANGDTLWTKTYGGTGDEFAYSVQQTTDNGYIIVGYTDSFGAGSYDVYLIKTDANGDTLWTKTYGGTGYDHGWSVQQTTDTGYIIAGHTESFGAALLYDVWLLKTDANGDTLWTKTYGGTINNGGYSVQQTADNGYVIVGFSMSTSNDVYLIKTDANGDTLWTKTYGGADSDCGGAVQQTADNGYIIAGYTRSFGAGMYDVWLLKTDANGDTLWTKIYGGANFDFAYAVQQTADNGYIIAGCTGSFGAGGDDVWLLRISGEPGIQETEGGVIPASYALSQSYPNPFKTETAIHYQLPEPGFVTVAIYNVSGQRIKTLVNEKRDAGYYTVRWDGRSQDGQSVSNGVYFCRMKAGEYISVKKILLTR